MKKILALILMLMIALSSTAFASDLGVQLIGGEDTAIVPMSLDDLQIGTSYTIDGYAVVVPKDAKIVQCFAQFGESGNYSVYMQNQYSSDKENNYNIVYSYSTSNLQKNSWRYSDAAWMDSGDSADFAWFLMDVTNLQKKSVEYIEEASIKVVYNDDYEFNGWIRQVVYDHMEDRNGDKGLSRYNHEKEDYPNEIVMNPAKIEPIDMMYTGTYAFGCTLPNYVIEDKKAPLRMEIKLGENDLTYHIRK